MKKGGVLGEVVERVKEEATEGIKTAVKQITSSQKKSGETAAFVKDLYGGNVPTLTEEEMRKKELEDKKKEEELRQRLHSEYYQRLTRPPKPKEERLAEKMEKEKRGELQKRQEEAEKKPLPIAAQKGKGTSERYRGVSG